MANRHVGVFDAAVVVGIDDNGVVGDFGELAAFGADECDRLHVVRVGPFKCFDEIGRIAAYAHAEDDVAGASEIGQLFREDLVVGVVVSERGDPGRIVVDGHAAEAAAEFVGGAFAEIGHEMGCVGCAAAIAEDENLAVFAPGFAKNFHQHRHAIGWN